MNRLKVLTKLKKFCLLAFFISCFAVSVKPFLKFFNISSLFFSEIFISLTFLGFLPGFTILSLFDLVTASAILFPKNSPALWSTFWKQILQHLVLYPMIVFVYFLANDENQNP